MGYWSASDIINVYNSLRNSLAGLSNLGYETSQWGSMVVRSIMRKMDSEILCHFDESIEGSQTLPSIDKLLLTIQPQPSSAQPHRKKSVSILTNTELRIPQGKPCVICLRELPKIFRMGKMSIFQTEKNMQKLPIAVVRCVVSNAVRINTLCSIPKRN